MHLNPRQYGLIAATFVRWIILGAGVRRTNEPRSAVFLALLNGATQVHQTAPLVIIFAATGRHRHQHLVYTRFGGAAALGNNLIIEELHSSTQRVPLRMAPLVLLATVVTHLFGGSAGREGTAVQMAGAMAKAGSTAGPPLAGKI